MQNQKTKISAPKGRPMLNWVGKQPLDYIKSFPAQLIETFNPLKSPLGRGSTEGDGVGNLSFKSLEHNWQNLLFHGDNKEILGSLLNNGFRGKIDLIYIDPPFDSGADYIRKVELRGVKDKTKIEGEDYNYLEQTQYFDIWNQDGYLQFMYERLQLLYELLSSKGALFLHVDYHKSHFLKILLDEIFGKDNFINEIVWKRRQGLVNQTKSFGTCHDNILYYVKNNQDYYYSAQFTKYNTEDYIKERFIFKEQDGRIYKLGDLGSPSYSPTLVYEYKGYKPPAKGWALSRVTMERFEKEGRIYFPADKNKRLMRKQFFDEWPGKYVQTIWDDIFPINSQAIERSDYPTQKPEPILERIIKTASVKNDIVLDCFVGSGTTAAVAQKLGRRWIGCDINKGAIQTTSKRLQNIILEQIEEEKKKHPELFTEESPSPSQGEGQRVRSFSHYKVNDYDLQLLRTEAIELAVQHIGIQRMKTDSFFEGVLGKTLVKIIDFNHPLTPLDIQLIQDELKKRPKEQRDITIVCLGKELSTEPLIDEYNKKHPVNKFQIIEIRTDTKYGKFLIHQPAIAEVQLTKLSKVNKVKIEIINFISPSILERLNIDNNLFKVKIPDFRSMIDVVLIDSNYNGKVFNIVYSDVPEKKNDLVEGKYEIEVPAKNSKVAIKIIDMLGEEVLVVK